MCIRTAGIAFRHRAERCALDAFISAYFAEAPFPVTSSPFRLLRSSGHPETEIVRVGIGFHDVLKGDGIVNVESNNCVHSNLTRRGIHRRKIAKDIGIRPNDINGASPQRTIPRLDRTRTRGSIQNAAEYQ